MGPESHTDTGRAVYGGGGITPDEIAKPTRVTLAEARLTNSIFAFALELTSGRVAGFENYKNQRAIEFNHDIQSTDVPVTEALFKEMKRFVAAKPIFKVTPAQLDRSRAFVERQLRFELATALTDRQQRCRCSTTRIRKSLERLMLCRVHVSWLSPQDARAHVRKL